MTLIYNLVMLAIDVVAIRFIGRRKGLLAWCGAVAGQGACGLALAGILGGCFEDRFGIFRLWAYGLFLHGVLLLTATTILWRRSRPWLAAGSFAAVLIALLIAADAFLVEPHWLEVSHWRFASPKIHHPIRIVVVADLQSSGFGPYEWNVLRQTLAEKPDIILLAGDYIQVPPSQRSAVWAELRNFLREIHFTAPGGVFAVRGNVDPVGWQEMFEGLDITAVDDYRSFELGDLQLTCLSLADSYVADLFIPAGPPDRFHLVLGHVPNFALGQVSADLLVAGHTHGGQVQLPGIGPLITNCRIPHTWAAGLTELPSGAKLLVSRGIGMERQFAPPMRFLCRPELTVIDLLPAN